MKIQTLKGFRDYLPLEAKKRQYLINMLKTVFETYGFEPLETPVLEYEEILTGKYGEESEKLIYKFEDLGKRKVAMRYDQTIPLARVIAQYQNVLPFPFKRYQIQPVWRAENTQKGRLREFLQCDIDTVGTNTPESDAEILIIIADVLKKFKIADYKILINDRITFADLPTKAIIIIDKLKKIGKERVMRELSENGFDPEILNKINNSKTTPNLKQIIESSEKMGLDEGKIFFDPTLARGLDYYTGTIIEVEIPGYSAGSVGGGGRYDNLIGIFSKKQIPAVGFSFGFDRIIEALEELNLFPNSFSITQILVTIFSQKLKDKSIELSSLLRSNNINAELYLDENAKMEKQLKYADNKGIPYVAIIGPEEVAKNVIVLKNMKTREQKALTLDDVVKILNT